MSKTNKIIEFVDVNYSVDEVEILKDINLSIEEGDFVSFVGPSGIGKTTLLKMILGTLKPTSGKVLIDGKVKNGPDTDCDIVYQKFGLFPHLKVRDNIIFGLENKYKHNKKLYRELKNDHFRKRQISKFVTEFYLKDATEKYPFQLSVGMQQRVAIAQSLVVKPKILLLDEPFSALDPWVRSDLHDFLLKLFAETKMTMILVTHDLEEAIYLSKKVVMVDVKNRDDGGATIVGRVKITEPYPRSIDFKTSTRLNVILSKLYKFSNSFGSKELVLKNVEIINMLNLLQEDQDLIFANALIGKIIFEIGKKINNKNLINEGLWIQENSGKNQKEIDDKIVWIFSNFIEKNNKIKSILSKLSIQQTQHTADRLIVDLLVEVDNLYKIF